MRRLLDTPKNRLKASMLLQNSGVVVFPTDTLYGLGACVFDTVAVGRIFSIKNRSTTQPTPILIGGLHQLTTVVKEIPPAALALAKAFWPGPLTLIMPAHPFLADGLHRDGKIAVRQPNHPSPLSLTTSCNFPITGTSANLSGGADPLSADQALEQIGQSVDLILDGGITNLPLPSTIVDPSSTPIRVLRLGAISLSDLRQVCSDVQAQGPRT